MGLNSRRTPGNIATIMAQRGPRGHGRGDIVKASHHSEHAREPSGPSRGARLSPSTPVHERGHNLVHRPESYNPFEFIVVSSLRAAQLMKGCTPRVEVVGKHTTTAQAEVAEGHVMRLVDMPAEPVPEVK